MIGFPGFPKNKSGLITKEYVMPIPFGYIEKIKEYEAMSKAIAIKRENRWWRRIPRERKKKKDSDAYYTGFAWAMSAYYLEKKPLEEITAISEGFDCNNPFDTGAAHAVSILKTHKMLGVLQHMEST